MVASSPFLFPTLRSRVPSRVPLARVLFTGLSSITNFIASVAVTGNSVAYCMRTTHLKKIFREEAKQLLRSHRGVGLRLKITLIFANSGFSLCKWLIQDLRTSSLASGWLIQIATIFPEARENSLKRLSYISIFKTAPSEKGKSRMPKQMYCICLGKSSLSYFLKLRRKRFGKDPLQ